MIQRSLRNLVKPRGLMVDRDSVTEKYGSHAELQAWLRAHAG